MGKPTLAELQTKLDGVRREVRNLTAMGMDPKQPPKQAALIKELERSARAEMRLRSMALVHAKGTQRSHKRRRCKRCVDPEQGSDVRRMSWPKADGLPLFKSQDGCAAIASGCKLGLLTTSSVRTEALRSA